jgi:D-beta-D-heptose 7-phosphate kinase/D-beta-D-heptose 1-phosphate adenosyltransferase
LLEALRPDVLVKGGTYRPEEVVGHEIVEAYGGAVRVTGMVDGISTSHIVASLARGDAAHRADAAPADAPAPAQPSPLRRAG